MTTSVAGEPEALWRSFVAALEEPLLSPFDPSKRVYWPFLLSALLITAGVWALHLRGRAGLWSFLLPRSILLHRSALLDYRLLFAKALVQAFLLGPLVIKSTFVAIWLSSRMTTVLGRGPLEGASPAVVSLLFTLAAFVAADLARYVVHRATHQVPALWELHKVHHSAEVLTPFTVYRTHPLESVLMRAGAALATGVTAGVFAWAVRGRVSTLEIAGVEALSFVWTLTGANLRHSHVWVSYGPLLERVFISPAQHQLHHSRDPRHHHANYGTAFALWDWAFGTLLLSGKREPLSFGLSADDKNHRDSVASVLLTPLWAAFLRVAGVRRGR